jgi:hypothetical protein
MAKGLPGHLKQEANTPLALTPHTGQSSASLVHFSDNKPQ